jgi:hypothetical protein
VASTQSMNSDFVLPQPRNTSLGTGDFAVY